MDMTMASTSMVNTAILMPTVTITITSGKMQSMKTIESVTYSLLLLGTASCLR